MYLCNKICTNFNGIFEERLGNVIENSSLSLKK